MIVLKLLTGPLRWKQLDPCGTLLFESVGVLHSSQPSFTAGVFAFKVLFISIFVLVIYHLILLFLCIFSGVGGGVVILQRWTLCALVFISWYYVCMLQWWPATTTWLARVHNGDLQAPLHLESSILWIVIHKLFITVKFALFSLHIDDRQCRSCALICNSHKIFEFTLH